MAQWTKYLDFINNVPPPAKDLEFFRTQEWLRPYLIESSLYRPVPFYARFDKGGTFDRFFNKVINTAETVPYAVGLVRVDSENWNDQLKRIFNGTEQRVPKIDGSPVAAEFIYVVHLREDVSGFEKTAHGGFLGALFDEAMSACIETVRQAMPTSERASQLFTAKLNLNFRAPVELPCTALFMIWLVKREGRKWYVKGKMIGTEGILLTEAEALWISTKTEKL